MKSNNGRAALSPLILVVDDERSVLDTICAILRLLGYEVLASEDGIKALTLYEEHGEEIDLILTDLLMPELSGIEMLQSMHAINPKLKAIIMSGYSDLISRGTDCGFIGGRLAKPFGVDQLTQEIRQVLTSGVAEEESGSAYLLWTA